MKPFLKMCVLVFGTQVGLYAQYDTTEPSAPDNWFNLDQAQDGFLGVSTEKAYKELLANKKSKKTIVVAVLDSGVEPDHEDLKDRMWVNPKEIPNNGIDDDKNGYVDDINGWNFIGGKTEEVNHDTYELTRAYKALNTNPKRTAREELYFKALKELFDANTSQLKEQLDKITNFKKSVELIKAAFPNQEEIAYGDVLQFQPKTTADTLAKIKIGGNMANGYSFKSLEKYAEKSFQSIKEQLDYGYNEGFEPRKVVGDEYKNLKNRTYGNNRVEGPDAMHGTHVAGIIAANRENKIGMKGVAADVKIMSVRIVPNGDERDKDIANGIYYAVDNGAQIINMSFGKGISPEKNYIDAAVKYAEKKGVLLVHAAGNSGENIDSTENYPCAGFGDCAAAKRATNWVCVGASSWNEEDLVAEFSNYGQGNVDLFAPGVGIYSTVPDNGYEPSDGTSMAAPVVSGVAALVWSYYPELTYKQLKEVLLKSAVRNDQPVIVPGSDPQAPTAVPFSVLSRTGGVVNAYEALQLAEKMVSKLSQK